MIFGREDGRAISIDQAVPYYYVCIDPDGLSGDLSLVTADWPSYLLSSNISRITDMHEFTRVACLITDFATLCPLGLAQLALVNGTRVDISNFSIFVDGSFAADVAT